jgi:dihydrofolate reductase
MGKVIESTFVSLDGVIGDPQVWGPPYWDDEHNAYASKLLLGSEALLLGRETYEGFAAAWPQRSGFEYADRINAMPKHVASRTLEGELDWNASVLPGDDLAAEVSALKASGDLLKFGTGELSRALLADRLVDEYHFWVFPVVAGGGQRLFEGLDTTHLKLVDADRFESGIVVHVLEPKK